jgi:hypothetical protein
MVFGGENLENDGWVIDSAGKTNSTLDEWFPDGAQMEVGMQADGYD